MGEWPKFYPEGIPPKAAKPASGVVFRLVDDIPPSCDDFKSSFEEFPDRDFGDFLWMAYGTSFFSNIEDIRLRRNRYKPLRNKRIATGELIPKLGKLMQTPKNPSTHITVWFRINADPENYIKTDAET